MLFRSVVSRIPRRPDRLAQREQRAVERHKARLGAEARVLLLELPAELDERLATMLRGHHRATDLLEGATAAGHRSLGWGDAGRLAVGAVADLVTVRLDSVRTAGLDPDSMLAGVVYGASAADVHQIGRAHV